MVKGSINLIDLFLYCSSFDMGSYYFWLFFIYIGSFEFYIAI